jgi:uncharacterized membrane protein
MMDKATGQDKHEPDDKQQGRRLLHRFIRSRPHLTLGIAFGTAVGLAWPDSHPWQQRALIGWNAGVWIYLAGMMWLMMRADHHKVREIASRQDENAGTVLFTLIVGVVLSCTRSFPNWRAWTTCRPTRLRCATPSRPSP